MVQAIFNAEKENRFVGCARVAYSSDAENEVIKEVTEDDLSDIFDAAAVNELAGTDEPIEAAVKEPLKYRDYLVLEDDEITFDGEHTRRRID